MSLMQIELNEASFLLETLVRNKEVNEKYIIDDIWDNIMTLTSPQYKRLLAFIYNSKYDDLFKSLDELNIKRK